MLFASSTERQKRTNCCSRQRKQSNLIKAATKLSWNSYSDFVHLPGETISWPASTFKAPRLRRGLSIPMLKHVDSARSGSH